MEGEPNPRSPSCMGGQKKSVSSRSGRPEPPGRGRGSPPRMDQ